eukprot:jgi/Mesvir1/27887/Mv20074-RA.1
MLDTRETRPVGMNESRPASRPVWTWMTRIASPREKCDVTLAVSGLCRTGSTPRQMIVKTYNVRGLVNEIGSAPYLACDYGPGTHCLLALVRVRGGRTVCALVHWDGTVQIVRMPPFKTKVFKGTVLEGVCVRQGVRTAFRAFDCLASVRRC